MTEALQQEIRTLKSVFESERDPEGRVFAPLADAYRRAGEVQQAVRLLNEGLARHPQFVPGHVVAAQLYVEQGLVEEAGLAARKALNLDEENVNALRSLLRVLEQNGDEEAGDVRDRLTQLDPSFQPEPAAPATMFEGPPALPDVDVAVDDEPALAVEETSSRVEDDEFEAPLEIDASGLDLAPEIDASEPDELSEEPLIDLDSLSSVGSEDFDEGGFELEAAVDIAPEQEAELPTEEPVLELEDLALVSEAPDEERDDMSAELASVAEVPGLSGEEYEEPVMELADLGPPDEDEPVALADLAPETEDEPVMDLSDLAPAEPEEETLTDLAALAPDEPVVELADLAPEAAEAEEDEPVALEDLAPDADEEPVALADLAPETEDEPVMDLSDLAPDTAEPEEEETVTDLAALAPDEPVMELADLAPEAAEAEEDELVALEDLAPDADEPVALADLAPDEDEPVALADLAPDTVDEPVVDLTDLAPDAAESASEVEDVAEADEEDTMVGLMARTADSDDASAPPDPASADASGEVVVDMDALRPENSAASADPADDSGDDSDSGEASGEGEGDDHEPGEPVYTRTLAELYVKQGAVGQAIEVYKHLASLDPGATDIQERIEELLSGKGLEEQAEPVLSEETEEEVEALARELSEGGHEASAEEDSPYNLHDGAEAGESDSEDEPSGPTIEDYFEGLLGWKPRER